MLSYSLQRPDVTLSGDGLVTLVDGRSEAIGASDAATKLVLFLHGEKVAEIPLHLVAGQLNVIRP